MSGLTYEQLKHRLSTIEKEPEIKKVVAPLEFKVAEKGGVSVYGMGHYPTTLYYEQWIKLLDAIPKLEIFLEENKSKLKLKGTK